MPSTLNVQSRKSKSMKKYNFSITRKCLVCDAQYTSENPYREVCFRPECHTILKTGKSMDDLVKEESQIPRDIPDNNHDYDEFDLEEMMNRREDEP